MIVHRDKFLVNETNRRTEFQFYWYYDSTRFGQPFCSSSGVLSRPSALVYFMQIWWLLLPGAGWNILILVTNDHKICIKCTNADERLRTPDDGQKGCPKHSRNTNKIGIQCVCWFHSQGVYFSMFWGLQCSGICTLYFNLVPNKLNALIKFVNKLVSLSTGSRNEIRKSLNSIHRNTCINSANGRS